VPRSSTGRSIGVPRDRQRWQIELFFKALKQNLRIQDFRRHQLQRLADSNLDRPDRAAPLKYLQLRARFGWSLSNLAALLRQQLFVYRDPVRLDRSALPASAAARCRRPANPALLVQQLGQQKSQPQPVNHHRQLKMPPFSSSPRFNSG